MATVAADSIERSGVGAASPIREQPRFSRQARLTGLLLVMVFLWPIGIEQLMPVIPIILAFCINWIQSGRAFEFGITRLSLVLCAFLIVLLFSGVGITEPYRFISYLRDLMIYASALLVMLHFAGGRTPSDLLSLARPMSSFFWVLLASTILYLLAPSFSFNSLGYYLVPASISDTMLGERTLVKSFGEQLYFYGFTDRVSSFFSSPIHFACIVFLVFPFALAFRDGLVWKATIYGATLFMLFFAQARAALVLFFVQPVLAYFLSIILGKRRAPGAAILISGFVAVSTVIVAVHFYDQIVEFFVNLFVERRAGSASTRFRIYQVTWDMILARPLFGYGTQIDVPGLIYPAGSHSTFLGAWFKHGVFGVILLVVLFLGAITRAIAHALHTPPRERESRLAFGVSSSLILYVVMLTANEYVVDVFHTYLLFSLLGTISALPSRSSPAAQILVRHLPSRVSRRD